MEPLPPARSGAGGAGESVHLESWSGKNLSDGGYDDPKLRKAMAWVRAAASAGLEKRASAGMPVRQALAKATVKSPEKREEWFVEILKDELNVLDVEWSEGDTFTIELDTVLTPELKRMGAARELVRTINDQRKNTGLTIKDRIVVMHSTESAFWHETLKEHGDGIMIDVKADGIETGRTEGDAEIDFGGEKIWVGIRKV